MKNGFYNMLAETVGEANVLENEPLSRHTTFRIGGAADYFVTVETPAQLECAAKLCADAGVEYMMLGNGSNVLVSDDGYRGVVICFGSGMSSVKVEEERIYAGAGALLSKIASEALKNSLTGFEFASGIPGTLGGAVLMNAGAYGGEMRDVLVKAEVFKPSIGVCEMSADELGLDYRTSVIKHNDWIVLSAVIELKKGDRGAIREKMESLKAERNAKQPVDMPSAGSAFKRPEGYFAGKLIMDAGLRGYSVGGAAVSEKHCGFIVNKGGATATDMKRLFDDVIDIVREKFGVTLEPEVRFIGKF